MLPRIIMFDLDGTLVDSRNGIEHTLRMTLAECGKPLADDHDLSWCLGASLWNIFERYLETTDRHVIERAVVVYRHIYRDGPMFEFSVYDGVVETLDTLRRDGARIVVATAKAHEYAREVIASAPFAGMIEHVYGSELDGTNVEKRDLIRHVLREDGALGNAHQFSILDAFSSPASVMEFHGHGSQTDVNAQWTIDLFVDQVETFLDANQWTAARVFGYSMGGYVAMQLAKKRPDLIAKIITLGTKLDWSVQGAHHEIKMLNAETIQTKVPAFAADLQRRHGADHWKTVLQKTADLMVDLGTQPRLTPQSMTEVQCPVRFMVGDADAMVSIEETVLYQRATPSSQLAVLPGTRHPIEQIRQDLLFWHLKDFLTS
jgi:phosphoglycolate phosphatase-like HAD superfamily hydrolase/esterase/lipase